MERSGSHLPQALADKQFMDCTVDGRWGLLCFFSATMLISKILIASRVVGVKRLFALWVAIALWI